MPLFRAMETCRNAAYNDETGRCGRKSASLHQEKPMLPSRRRLFTILARAVGVLATESLLCSSMSAQHTPQPIPSPHAPNQNFPPGLDGPDQKPGSDNKSVDPKTREEISADIQKLYELASELREQAGKADLNVTLPVSLVKKAQQIEKLARKIKDLSKG
jgi:hypothetical protein